MTDFFMIILKLIMAYFAFQYIVGPILIYFSQKFPEKYKFIRLNKDVFLSERSKMYLEIHQEILEEEFVYIGSSEMLQSNSSLYFSI